MNPTRMGRKSYQREFVSLNKNGDTFNLSGSFVEM